MAGPDRDPDELVWEDHDQRIAVHRSRGQDDASLKADLARTSDFVDGLAAGGVGEWSGTYRWVGPVKVLVGKEVGPPPWPRPKVRAGRRGLCVHVTVGWRSTAYTLYLLWTGWSRG